MNMVTISTTSFDGQKTSSALLDPNCTDVEHLYDVLAGAWVGQDEGVLAVAAFKGQIIVAHYIPEDDEDDAFLLAFISELTNALQHINQQ